MSSPSQHAMVAGVLAVTPAALAYAQEAAGPTPAPGESQLWWMWVALALVLLGALVAIMAGREPRARVRS